MEEFTPEQLAQIKALLSVDNTPKEDIKVGQSEKEKFAEIGSKTVLGIDNFYQVLVVMFVVLGVCFVVGCIFICRYLASVNKKMRDAKIMNGGGDGVISRSEKNEKDIAVINKDLVILKNNDVRMCDKIDTLITLIGGKQVQQPQPPQQAPVQPQTPQYPNQANQ